MSTVRDVIVESAARANVCPRKRSLPEDIFVSALNLFNGVLQEFSTKNYIEAYKAELDLSPKFESIFVGKQPEDSGEPQEETEPTPDTIYPAPQIQLPKRVLYRYAGAIDWVPMEFIAYDDFYSSTYSDYIVSWQPAGINLWKLYFKPRFIQGNPEIKLVYNVEMQYSDNDTINLPTPYVELITRALAYKLAVKYPRVDETAKAGLLKEFTDLEKDLTAINASNRIITRGGAAAGGNLNAWFRSGGFIASRIY